MLGIRSTPDEDIQHRLERPRTIGFARDPAIQAVRTYDERRNLFGYPLIFGPDIEHGTGRNIPFGSEVADNAAELANAMRRLLEHFARSDDAGIASRIFEHFLQGNAGVGYYEDPNIDFLASRHPNMTNFCDNLMRTTIHDRLARAKWNINKMFPNTLSGFASFNLGRVFPFSTQDNANGMRLAVNSVQHVVAVAEGYYYDVAKNVYHIDVKFWMYDVFGLDDGDIEEFGNHGRLRFTKEAIGFAAWWQLQHQFNYAPMITRWSIRREYTIPAISGSRT